VGKKEAPDQRDNPVPIPYSEVIENHKNGEFEILGCMPDTFQIDLLEAIEDSITLSPVEAARIKKLIKHSDPPTHI
jgi:hypothetical protein